MPHLTLLLQLKRKWKEVMIKLWKLLDLNTKRNVSKGLFSSDTKLHWPSRALGTCCSLMAITEITLLLFFSKSWVNYSSVILNTLSNGVTLWSV